MKYSFGVDIGGTTVKLGLFEGDGKLLEKWEIKTHVENGGEAILPDVAKALKEKAAEKSIAAEQILGVGVDVPAPVSADGIVNGSVNIGWGYKDVRRELEEATGWKVVVGNDANVAALGEMWLGAGRGSKDLLMVTLGTGLGGGIIIDGKAVVGSKGAGGEVGHICVNPHETETCGCGRKGCAEMYTSATGIARLARRRLQKDDAPSVLRDIALEKVSAKDVFDAVKAGDKVADEIADQFGRILGRALANMAVMTDPEIIVVGGGVSKAGAIVIDYVEKYYQEAAFFANKDVKFVMAELGNDAGICGCAQMVAANC